MERQSKADRAERLIRDRFGLSARHAEEALEQGLVTDERGGTLKKGSKVESVRTEKLEALLEALKRGHPTLQIPIVHDEIDFVVVDKPAGIASHPLSLFEEATVTHWAFARYPDVT